MRGVRNGRSRPANLASPGTVASVHGQRAAREDETNKGPVAGRPMRPRKTARATACPAVGHAPQKIAPQKLYPMRDTADELKALRNSAPKPSPSVPELRKIVSKMNLQKLFYKNYNRQFSLARSLHPPCYVQFLFTSVPIKSLHEETLFYIFYALHDTDIQIKAYNELIARNYLYSRALEHFVHNCPRVADRKKRSVIVFDHLEWIKVIREVVLDEEFVESLESYVDEKSGAW